ncbi:MAG: helix-turn-helix domain-containing protein [Parvibaculum sp.]|nr:helix-turn-helix domain-containing protein [Parvibaculum sp.]
MSWSNQVESAGLRITLPPKLPRAVRADLRQLRDRERAAQVALTQETIAGAFKISVAEMRAPTRRTAPVAQARQIAMYLMHVSFGLSLSAVGRHFGRDRTTAAHACRQIEDRRDDAAFDVLMDRLEFSLRTKPGGGLRQ